MILGIPMLHDIENPSDEDEIVPVSIFTWVRDMFFSVWHAYKVRNYYPLKM